MESQLKILLLPKDPNDDKNVILEVRAGTGGEEAALFAQDLLRMYLRYAERRGWKAEIMDANDTGIGGIKELSLIHIWTPTGDDLRFDTLNTAILKILRKVEDRPFGSQKVKK